MDDLLENAIIECFVGRNDEKGAMCKRIKGDKLHVCSAFVKMRGEDPQTGENLDEWRCALNWMPIIGVENSRSTRQQTNAVQALRGDVSTGNKMFATVVAEAKNASLSRQ